MVDESKIRNMLALGEDMDVTMEPAPADKIRLFRAMFRGRKDVYARRYVNAKSGKSGCSPRLYHDYICVVFTIRHGGMW